MRILAIDPGAYIHVKDNVYKIPYIRNNGRKGNRYFIKNSCAQCGKSIFQHKSNYDKSNGIGYCSKKCGYLSREHDDGFIRITHKKQSDKSVRVLYHVKMKNHPNARKGWLLLHRYNVEKERNIILDESDIVHHIDMDEHNNEANNMYVFKSNEEHHISHGTMNRCVAELMKMGIVKFNKGVYSVENIKH